MSVPGNWQKSSFSGSGDGNACLELASTPTALAHLLAGIRTHAVPSQA